MAFKIPKLKIPVSPAALGGGLVAVVCMVGFVFYVQRGAHIELTGKVLKVRTAPLDENASIAAVDFRVSDPADYGFIRL